MIPLKKINDDLEISKIGLGTWAMGGPWKFGWGSQDSNESKQTILKALNEGVNWIDTAPAYGLGHAEELIGQVLKSRRKDVIIATKCGIVWESPKNISFSIHPKNIRKECEDSLKRLNTDYIDLYQIHWPDSKTPIADSWGEMIKLKNEGKVKNIGVCNFNLNLLKKCERMEHISTLQPPYNMLKREIESEIIPWCIENKVAILAYSPLQSGLLTGKIDKEYIDALSDDDWRKRNPMFKDPWFSKALEFIERIKKTSSQYNRDLTSFAIAWILSHETVASAIVGVRNVGQASEISKGAGWKIKKDDMEKIDIIFNEIFNRENESS
ncbi:MAG: aldo/keto reductase [Spirochaetia bacterium]|nr:aldo/keto reductase [Spirochaetia bacterium]